VGNDVRVGGGKVKVSVGVDVEDGKVAVMVAGRLVWVGKTGMGVFVACGVGAGAQAASIVTIHRAK
jgi:hypothetical protein